MTDQPQKPDAPREWWIVDSLMSGRTWIAESPLNPDHQEKAHEVHVIEKSAYDKLRTLFDKMAGLHSKQCEKTMSEVDKRLALQKRCEEMKSLAQTNHTNWNFAEEELANAKVEIERLQYHGAAYWKAQYETLKNDLRFDVETNSATGWMVKYQRQLDLVTQANARIKELEAERDSYHNDFRVKFDIETKALHAREQALVDALEKISKAHWTFGSVKYVAREGEPSEEALMARAALSKHKARRNR